MLLSAARSPTEEDENHPVSAIEQPGMDALRGGFGTIGSILRARSVRRMNSASSNLSQGLPFSNSTGWDGMPRYQLSDTPIHENPTEEISHKKGEMSFVPYSQSRNPTLKSLLKFDDQDIVHQYDRTGHGDAIHTARTHNSTGEVEYGTSHRTASDTHNIPYLKSPSEEKSGHTFFGARPFKSFRRRVSGSNEEEALASVPLTPMTPQGILDSPTSHNFPGRMTDAMDSSNSRTSFNTLLNKFAATEGPDLRLNHGRRGSREPDDMVRGGAHRGTKDYPHLKKSAAEQELEERQGLVGDSEQRSGSDASDDGEDQDEKVSSPLSMSSVEQAEVTGVVTRRLPNVPVPRSDQGINVAVRPPSQPRDSGDLV
ncbi:hypothetical protein QFC19_001658 [Naganishia cerealis]|uniref:Uncharacterized protein n=1 Tax=Naganishia cerealis TaxID=610337 RepID=A0ACC2WG01_9TREE|nr:hypothetical protein QFC19_001658 [Naganishia cerealis]